MKIIHIPYCFHPDPIGGTEVYVQALVRRLQQQQVEGIIVAPGNQNQTYLYEDLLVRRFALSTQISDLRELYGEGDRQAITNFAKILDEEKPDLVHLHAFTSGASLALVRTAKQRRIPTVFTYHTPTVSCVRGTLMRWGSEVCNGHLQLVGCTRCVLQGQGLNRTNSTLVGTLPPSFGALLGRMGRQGGVWTALRMSELIALRHATTHALFNEVNHIVVVANWIREVLLRNGVSKQKITLCRHGLAHEHSTERIRPSYSTSNQLRLVFLGRLDETKGIDIVIRALHALPNALITLDIYGIVQDQVETEYQRKLLTLIKSDERISLHPPVAGNQVISILQNYDLLVVPSRCLETGPLVVLEAFAAGIPVVGSKLGGIAEWVKDGVNGVLVEPDSVWHWCEVLMQFTNDKGTLEKLHQGIQPPSTMHQVAQDTLKLYDTILKLR